MKSHGRRVHLGARGLLGEVHVPRLLYIISRRNQRLYADLTRTSTNDSNVGVVLDRRHGERRQRSAPHRVDRRVSDRRLLNTEEHLLRLGWAVADEKSDLESGTKAPERKEEAGPAPRPGGHPEPAP